MSMSIASNTAEALSTLCDDEFQGHLLQGVSRTFALTIPQLPQGLAKPVSNAYLLCRIVDTIEDEVALSPLQKREFCTQFAAVVRGHEAAAPLSLKLAPLLSENTIPAEHELIRLIPRVIDITHSFEPQQQNALADCVEIMAKGMIEFQDKDLHRGLATMREMDRYCYFVAGVVGEMLTRLFCHYSSEIRNHESEMMDLAVSFGQGLQMTNILKDLWDDHARGVCWLPRDIFEQHGGYDLASLKPGHKDEAFKEGFSVLIGIAHRHLKNALEYTLSIPSHEFGMREFCLWALGMAILTLRKIHQHLDFDQSSQVKITRKAVKTTIITSRILRRSDTGLRLAFALAGRGLPIAPPIDLPISH
jgi:farnesyl-diphosphate farnesyltransferase